MRFEALIWKLSGIFLLILITERAAVDYGNSNYTATQPPTGQNETNGGRRKGETSSPFDYLYDTLVDNDLNKMCSILRNPDAQQTIGSLGNDYTILAPSDEAFSLVPGSKLDELRNDPQKRKEFLLRHIIPGRLVLNRLGPNDETEVAALDGNQLHITAYPNGFVINGANVLNGDIPIANTNGLIHILDRVMIPEQETNLLELMEQNPQLSQISSFLTLSGLQKELTTKNTFTFFCPNDEAFRAIPWPVTQQMLSNNTFLRLLMANHIIPGKHYSTGLPGNQLYSIGGDLLNFTTRTVQSRQLVLVNSVPIINPDLIASNGVIHVITRIMLPKHLLDDCNCLPRSTTTAAQQDSNTTANYNETSLSDSRDTTTPDPLYSDFGLSDSVPSNSFNRRLGAIPRNQNQNYNHFSSTPKPVSFKSFWDDIFGSSEQPPDATQSTVFTSNDSQTTLNEQNNQTYPLYNMTTTQTNQTTDTPFIWDPFSTEAQPTSGRFTYRPTGSSESSSSSDRPEADSQSKPGSVNETSKTRPDSRPWNQSERLKTFTPGVEYYDQPNTSTTTTVDSLSSQWPSSTWPSIRTRPYYRPETTTTTKQNETQASQVNRDSNRTDETTTQTSSHFRPTGKPYFRPTPTTEADSSTNNNNNNQTRGVTSASSLRPEDKTRPTTRDQYERRSLYRPSSTGEPVEQVKEDESIEPTQPGNKRNDLNSGDRRFDARKEPTTTQQYGSDRPTSVRSDSPSKRYQNERPRPQLRPDPSLNQTDYSRPQDREPVPSTYGSRPEDFSRRQLRPYDSNETQVLPEYESTRRYPVGPADSQRRPPSPPYETYPSEPPRRETRPYYSPTSAQPNDASDTTRPDQNTYRPYDSRYSPVPHRTDPQESPRRQSRPSYGPSKSDRTPDYEPVRTNQKEGGPGSEQSWPPSRSTYPYRPDSQSRPGQQQYSPEAKPFSRKGPEPEPDTGVDSRPRPPSYGGGPQDFSRRQSRPNYQQDDSKSSPRSDPPNRYPQQYSDTQQSPYYEDKSQPSAPADRTYAEQPYNRRQNTPDSYKVDRYSGQPIERPAYRPTSPQDFDPRTDSQRRDQQYGDESPAYEPPRSQARPQPRPQPRPQTRPELRPKPNYENEEKGRRRLGPVDYNNIRRYGEQQPPRPSDPRSQTTSSKARPQDNTDTMKTIGQIIESPNLRVDGKDKHFSVLKDMMTSSGLSDALDKPTTYITIFMPTDEAFGSLPDDLVRQMKEDPSLVRKILMQHVLSYSLPPQNLRNNMIVKSLNGEPHIINIVDGGKIVVDGTGVIAVTSAKNGIVYVVDQLLQKPEGKSRSIMDELRKRSDLSTFSSLIQRTNYGQKLSKGPGPYTVFVPNNNAFMRMQSHIRELANNRRTLEDFVRNHVMEGAVYSDELALKDAPDSSGKTNGYGHRNRYTDRKPAVNDRIKLLASDITTGNGVIHIVDDILSANNTFEKRTEKSEKLRNTNGDEKSGEQNGSQASIANIANKLGTKRFINWLTKSGLIDDMVKDKREYTVIVPNDRAVGKLPLKIQSLLNTEPSRLRNLLEYHILPGFVLTETLKDNEILVTISGKEIRFNRLENGTLMTFSGAPIAKQEYYENLLIISVENVLYPPQGNIQTIVSKSPILKTMAQIIKKAEMEEELAESGPFAIFAPKDEAFKQIDPKILESLKNDANASKEFVRKHIVPKVMFTSSLPISSDGSNIRTTQALSGDTLKFQRKPNCVSVNGIILSYADITATNGVLHVIDHVL